MSNNGNGASCRRVHHYLWKSMGRSQQNQPFQARPSRCHLKMPNLAFACPARVRSPRDSPPTRGEVKTISIARSGGQLSAY